MLADVIKEQINERKRLLEEERQRYNQPYKRDTIVYIDDIHVIGGIETWVKNLAKDYEFTLVYSTGDRERLDYYKELGIECVKYVEQPIECNTLIRTVYGHADIKAKKTYIFIHGDYKYLDQNDLEGIPKNDGIYAVSKVVADSFKELTGEETKVLYNPVYIEETIKPIVIGVFSRLSAEKGRKRIEYLIEQLNVSKRPFFMLIFTDLPYEINDNRVIFLEPVMNPIGWMSICDYVCQLSDTEAGSYTIQESLKLGKPIIVTKLPILEEFNITDKEAKIINFDMSNLDIEDLWNIPKVKWKEPISKEWEDIMKKRVFRAKQEQPIEKPEIKEIKEEPKKEVKKTTKKKSDK